MTGIILAVLAVLLLAVTPVLAKAGTRKTDSVLAGGLSGLAYIIFYYITTKNVIGGYGYSGIPAREWVFLLLAGIAVGFFAITFYKSAHYGDVSTVSAIQKCHVIFVTIVGMFLFHDQLETRNFIIMGLIAIGTIIMIWAVGQKGSQHWQLTALLAALAMTAARVLVRYGVSVNSQVSRFIVIVIAVLMLILITIFSGGWKKIRAMSFIDGICLILAGITYPISVILYNRSAAMIGNIAEYIYNAALVLTVILASVWLREKITGVKILGAIVFVAAFYA